VTKSKYKKWNREHEFSSMKRYISKKGIHSKTQRSGTFQKCHMVNPAQGEMIFYWGCMHIAQYVYKY